MADFHTTTNVAFIIDQGQFVLASGSDHGLESGMKFGIIDASYEIQHPETKTVIGKLLLHKQRVVLTKVTRLFSICDVVDVESVTHPTRREVEVGDVAVYLGD